MGNLGQVAYGTAKLALTGLLSTLVAQFGHRLRVNQVNPSIIVTDSANWKRRRLVDADWEHIEAHYTPARELGRPVDVAHLIAWLSSDEARFVNGAVIDVDGGLAAAGICHPSWDATDFRRSYVDEARKHVPARKAA